MTTKVFGIGFPKTGTTSLEVVMEELGYVVCKGHYNNNYTNYLVALYLNDDYTELEKIITYFEGFADAPWGGTILYKRLLEIYPDAKYILTVRNPEKWYDSLCKMFTKFDQNLATTMDTFHKYGRYGGVYYFKKTFGIQTMEGNRDKMIAHYIKHNEEVKEYFKEIGKELLVVNIINDPSWKAICSFLGKPIPQQEFPHANKGVGSVEEQKKYPIQQKVLPSFKQKLKKRLHRIVDVLLHS